jgi:hypothetical protein
MVEGIICVLQKAFDCIDHGILLSKLNFYSIRCKFLSLIKTYLEGRCQKVQLTVNNRHNIISTEWREISSGGPQGSILGPLFFLIYINDLPLILERHSFPAVFADDITGTNSTNFLNNSREIFSKLNKWFSANLLSLNYDTTNFLQFRTKNYFGFDVIFEYNNKSIDTKLDTKLLGIIVDSTLQW